MHIHIAKNCDALTHAILCTVALHGLLKCHAAPVMSLAVVLCPLASRCARTRCTPVPWPALLHHLPLSETGLQVNDIAKAAGVVADMRKVFRSDTRIIQKLHRRVFLDKITPEQVRRRQSRLRTCPLLGCGCVSAGGCAVVSQAAVATPAMCIRKPPGHCRLTGQQGRSGMSQDAGNRAPMSCVHCVGDDLHQRICGGSQPRCLHGGEAGPVAGLRRLLQPQRRQAVPQAHPGTRFRPQLSRVHSFARACTAVSREYTSTCPCIVCVPARCCKSSFTSGLSIIETCLGDNQWVTLEPCHADHRWSWCRHGTPRPSPRAVRRCPRRPWTAAAAAAVAAATPTPSTSSGCCRWV